MTGIQKTHCGYCNSSDSVSFYLFQEKLEQEEYLHLLWRGWRRSGCLLYKPIMHKTCCPAYPIRLNVEKFKISKQFRQCANKMLKYLGLNSVFKDLNSFCDEIKSSSRFKAILEPSSVTTSKYNLFEKYQSVIHNDKTTKQGFYRFLVKAPFESFHLCYYLDEELVAVSVLDLLQSSISSVYFYYNPDYSFLSLGKFSALFEIQMVKGYYIMGYYIHNCVKMSYKAQLHGSELMDHDFTWVDCKTAIEKLKESKTKYIGFNSELKIPNLEGTIQEQLNNLI